MWPLVASRCSSLLCSSPLWRESDEKVASSPLLEYHGCGAALTLELGTIQKELTRRWQLRLELWLTAYRNRSLPSLLPCAAILGERGKLQRNLLMWLPSASLCSLPHAQLTALMRVTSRFSYVATHRFSLQLTACAAHRVGERTMLRGPHRRS